MNAVEQRLLETIESISKGHCNYQERKLLKSSDMRLRIGVSLRALRRFTKRTQWTQFISLEIVLFSSVMTSPRASSAWLLQLVMLSIVFTTILMVRKTSVDLAKMETLADLWLRQNQSSLAEFDAANLLTVKNEALAAGR